MSEDAVGGFTAQQESASADAQLCADLREYPSECSYGHVSGAPPMLRSRRNRSLTTLASFKILFSSVVTLVGLLPSFGFASNDDLKTYVTQTVIGDPQQDGRTIALWQNRQINYQIIFVGDGDLQKQFPQLAPTLVWIEAQFQDQERIRLSVSVDSSEVVPPRQDSSSSIRLIVVEPGRLDAPSRNFFTILDGVRLRQSSAPNCILERWRRNATIVQATAVLILDKQPARNVKCVSTALLFGLGLTVTASSFSDPPGVMTPDVDPDWILPFGSDMEILKFLYSGDVVPGESKELVARKINAAIAGH